MKKELLKEFDESILKEYDADIVVGIDEAGRGPLAGPVVAAAAYIPGSAFAGLPEIDDSKKLSDSKRRKYLSAMIRAGVRFGFGYCSSAEIDGTGILPCVFSSMRKAAEKIHPRLPPSARVIFAVDGNLPVRDFPFRQTVVTKGDSRSLSIAAASIFAKVVRDNWMNILHLTYPQYGFDRHKGYGTGRHISAIKENGPCPVHRKSFAGAGG